MDSSTLLAEFNLSRDAQYAPSSTPLAASRHTATVELDFGARSFCRGGERRGGEETARDGKATLPFDGGVRHGVNRNLRS